MMRPNIRKFVRTIHIIVTVGWLGAVASFLVLAIIGVSSPDALLVRGSYVAMDLIARFVIVPLSLIPLLLTGPILSLGTPWGLFRHYWIIVKLVINFLSTAILLVHMQLIGHMARAAARGVISPANHQVQIQLLIAAAAGLVALIAATVLAVYKPRGMTLYGWRQQYGEHPESRDVELEK
jgi:hypothetical protein